MATTTNYGWTTPDDTALVKDGAAAIRTLGSSVDTTTKNLNPETTLGDLAYRSSTANVKTRLGLGTAGQVLQVNSGANAPEWATISAGGMTSIATGSLSTTSTEISGISGSYIDLVLVINSMQAASGNFEFLFNNDSAASYGWNTIKGTAVLSTSTGAFYPDLSTPTSANNSVFIIYFRNYASSKIKSFNFQGGRDDTSSTFSSGSGIWNNTAALTSITILNGASFSAGTYIVYGVK
jgi:hypothetical protein